MTQPLAFENHNSSWSSGRGGWCGSSGDSLALEPDVVAQAGFSTQRTTGTKTLSCAKHGRYKLPAGAFFATPANSNGSTAASDALGTHVNVVISEQADGEIVIDLTDITKYAYLQFSGGSSATPGGSLGNGSTPWPVFPATVGGTAYVPSPTVTLSNHSTYAAFVTVNSQPAGGALSAIHHKGAFGQVAPSNGIYPREHYTLRYSPIERSWLIDERSQV